MDRFPYVAQWLEEGVLHDAGGFKGTMLAYALRFDRLVALVCW